MAASQPATRAGSAPAASARSPAGSRAAAPDPPAVGGRSRTDGWGGSGGASAPVSPAADGDGHASSSAARHRATSAVAAPAFSSHQETAAG